MSIERPRRDCVSTKCSAFGPQHIFFRLFSTAMASINRAMAKMMTFLISGYQYCISPLMRNHCRFYPSCSEYAFEVVTRFGFLKGLFLATRRLLRCHPWHSSFDDPVPLE